MSAILKVYTDAGHTTEVAHTSQNNTTLNNGGTLNPGAISLTLASTAGMPASGMIDIDTSGNLETIPYFGLSGSVIQLSKPTAISHANGVAVVQWCYQLAIGDQANGISNDGTNAAANGSVNGGTWYVYNAGDQVAQSPVFSTSNAAPGTANGFTDTNISITSNAAGFAASVSPSNIAVGGVQQIWVDAFIPLNQNPAGSNPQLCVLNLGFNSI